MLTPAQFKNLRENLLETIKNQKSISTNVDLNELTLSELTNTTERLNDNTLKVLFLGRFSSGKSTVLNALIGQDFLPAKSVPTTAIIGEIEYSETPEVLLFPKDNSAPFNVDITRLGEYITIDHDANANTSKHPNPYKKILVKYPLQACKNGIVFIDSPGLDDPTCHDTITKEYLPNTDAIVYCMNSCQAFGKADKFEIERLIALGYKSIIFVLTHFDVLLNNDKIMCVNNAEETRKHYTKILSKYTDLGSSGIFFIGSLPALRAKKTNDQKLLTDSLFPFFEKRLEEVLFNEKGKIKLLKAIYSIRKANRETAQLLTDKIEIASADKNKLAEGIFLAQKNLDQVQIKANEIKNQFNIDSQKIIIEATNLSREFFFNKLVPEIEVWISEFSPSSEAEISFWNLKSSVAKFTEECTKHVHVCMETMLSTWCQDELIKNYVLPEIKKISEKQVENLESFEELLETIRINLSLSVKDSATTEETPGALNRISAAIAGFIAGGPFGVAIGGITGWDGLLNTFVSSIVATIILGIISIFTPIGWIGITIAAISALIVGTSSTIENIEEKVRGKIYEEMLRILNEERERIPASIGEAISSIIFKIQEAISDNLQVPILQYENYLKEANENLNAKGNALKTQIEEYNQYRETNMEIGNQLDRYTEETIS